MKSTFNKFAVVVLILMVAPLLMAAAPAQSAPSDWTNLVAVLQWLAGVGGPFFVGYLFSLLAENWPAWHTLPRFVKFISPMIASVIVAILATLALQQKDAIAVIAPWFTIVASAVLGYLGTQKAYMDAKRSGYGAVK